MPQDSKPQIATNQGGSTVAQALQSFIGGAASELAKDISLGIATAYFNIGGFELLHSVLEKIPHTRLLLGVEPTDTPRPRVLEGVKKVSTDPARAEKDRIKYALADLEADLVGSRDLLGFTYEITQATKRLVGWLQEAERVEVRMLKETFLHGKAYLITTANLDHGVLAGSSNFTRAGLTTNAELNLGNYDSPIVRQAKEWFEEQWHKAEPFDLAGLYQDQFEPHSPHLIYLRMLWEWSKSFNSENESESVKPVENALDLTSFQIDGLLRAREILEKYYGVLIADEVGLGKTYIAGEIIRHTIYDLRQKALVIAPAVLRDGTWTAFIKQKLPSAYNIPGSQDIPEVQVVSYEDLLNDKQLNPNDNSGRKLSKKLDHHPDEYSLIVVDEAHNARTPTTQRSLALRRLLKSSSGTSPKKLVLLTATPVNNSLWDLYHLLFYFLTNDGVFAAQGVTSVRNHFKWAMSQNPFNLEAGDLFDVIDPVTVRRTRKFIKKHYAGDTIIGDDDKENVVKFPTPRNKRVDYDFGPELSDLFDRFTIALDPTNNDNTTRLTLTRYMPSTYLLAGNEEKYELQNAGLLRSLLLKRFESSPCAFANTCSTMANSHDAFLALLEQGKVGIGQVLKEWVATDSDEIDDIDKFMGHHSDSLEDASKYDVETLKAAIEHDCSLLRGFADEAGSLTPANDTNLQALVEELVEIVEQAQKDGHNEENKRNCRKLLIFSYYADTVDWIYDYLIEAVANDERLSVYQGRVASISGAKGRSKEGNVAKKDVLWGFAPKTTQAPKDSNEDLYDIVISTDVLAEGVNLQQARHIINYDLPWNPMRLVQRHGRIDRIGSPHSEVFIRCVFPDKHLSKLLDLEGRIRYKLRQAAVSVGVVDNVVPEAIGIDQVYSETREEIEKVRNEDTLIFEQGGTERGAISGEEFRRELAKARYDQELQKRIEALPWGSGSGMACPALTGAHKTGFVFCARVGTKHVVFRYVEVDNQGNVVSTYADKNINHPADADEADRLTGAASDTLTCLTKAQPPEADKTERILSDETQNLAFLAWKKMQTDIYRKWNETADPAYMAQPLKKAQRQALEMLRAHTGLAEHKGVNIDEAIRKVEAPLLQSQVHAIRNALKGHQDNSKAQVQTLLKTIDELGLRPYNPPKTLPQINEDDIYLVCWLALSPPAE